jgi:membrane protein YdbS with pleckstrin-like domain
MSPLQTQFPLSPKKFWKKMIGSIIGTVILFIILVPIFWLMHMAFAGSSDAPIGFWVDTVVAGVLALGIVVLLIKVWYIKAYIRRYYYSNDEHFITIKKGVFAPTEIHVQYAKIQDVYVDQDILDRMMGLYDVHIASATATSGIEAHIDGVEQAAAEGLKNMFLTSMKNATYAPAAPQAVAAPGATMAAMAAPAAPAMPTEEISSKTYPIVGAWVVQSVIKWFFSSVVTSGAIAVYINQPSSDSKTALFEIMHIPFMAAWFVLFVIIFLCHIIYVALWKSTYSFAFLPDYILMRSGIIARSEKHVPYQTVQDVVVNQGIVERLFGLATVTIQNAAQNQTASAFFKGTNLGSLKQAGISIPGQPLAKANKLSETIRAIILSRNAGRTGL